MKINSICNQNTYNTTAKTNNQSAFRALKQNFVDTFVKSMGYENCISEKGKNTILEQLTYIAQKARASKAYVI